MLEAVMTADYLDRLAAFVVDTRLEDLLESTVTAAKNVVLDTIGAMLAGSRLQENANLARMVSEMAGRSSGQRSSRQRPNGQRPSGQRPSGRYEGSTRPRTRTRCALPAGAPGRPRAGRDRQSLRTTAQSAMTS